MVEPFQLLVRYKDTSFCCDSFYCTSWIHHFLCKYCLRQIFQFQKYMFLSFLYLFWWSSLITFVFVLEYHLLHLYKIARVSEKHFVSSHCSTNHLFYLSLFWGHPLFMSLNTKIDRINNLIMTYKFSSKSKNCRSLASNKKKNCERFSEKYHVKIWDWPRASVSQFTSEKEKF